MDEKFVSHKEDLNPLVDERAKLAGQFKACFLKIEEQLERYYVYKNRSVVGSSHISLVSSLSSYNAHVDPEDYNNDFCGEIGEQLFQEVTKLNEEVLAYVIQAFENMRAELIKKYNSLINYNGEDTKQT